MVLCSHVQLVVELLQPFRTIGLMEHFDNSSNRFVSRFRCRMSIVRLRRKVLPNAVSHGFARFLRLLVDRAFEEGFRLCSHVLLRPLQHNI